MLKNIVVVLSTLAILFTHFESASALKAKAWQNTAEFSSSFAFPEEEYGVKQNVGIAFTGGGSRSYLASLGYMAGLESLDLTKNNIDYISGISGGSWATMVYMYGSRNGLLETEFLGPIVQPADITESGMKVMSDKCARKVTDSKFVSIALESILHEPNLGEMWCYATQKVYLDPVGINANQNWAYNQDQIDDIKRRNPELNGENFLLPRAPTKAFPLVGSALVGPEIGSPYSFKRDNQNYTFLEITPLYTGHVKTLEMEYNKNLKKEKKNEIQSRTVGGFLETFAFNRKANTTDGSNIAPEVGLANDETSAVLDIPRPAAVFDIAHAAGASSFAPGTFMESMAITAKPAGLSFNYYSPTNPQEAEATGESRRHKNKYDTLFSDGGAYENICLISYLQRKVKKVVYCSNSATPLQPSASWDVAAPGGHDVLGTVDDSIPAFFGIFLPNKHTFQDRSFEYQRDQIFDTADYNGVIQGLQAAQAVGKGIMYRTILKTVENTWWGIEGGQEVDITFICLGRLSQWEAQLSDDMKKVVMPDADKAGDLANTVKKGPFKHFPHYDTQGADIDNDQANILADMVAWSVQENEELFRDIFS